MSDKLPKPPRTYTRFVTTFPKLGKAWEHIHEAGADGPIDARTARLIKLGIAMGAMREGSVHSGVRKAVALGITPEEIRQVVAMCASTLGMPSTVAVFSWAEDVLEKGE